MGLWSHRRLGAQEVPGVSFMVPSGVGCPFTPRSAFFLLFTLQFSYINIRPVTGPLHGLSIRSIIVCKDKHLRPARCISSDTSSPVSPPRLPPGAVHFFRRPYFPIVPPRPVSLLLSLIPFLWQTVARRPLFGQAFFGLYNPTLNLRPGRATAA